MELRQINAFVTLADTLNFTRAADLLYISQSTLSKQLSALESELGVCLLARDTHSTLLTENGMAFLQEARKILTHVDRATEAAKLSRPDYTFNNLIIGFDSHLNNSPMTGAYMDLFASFTTRFPDTVVEMRDMEISKLYRAFSSDEIDIAFALQEVAIDSAFSPDTFNSVTIFEDHFVFLFPDTVNEDHSSTQLIELINKYNRVFLARHSALFASSAKIFQLLGVFPSVQFNDSFADTLMRVSRGDGFTICPLRQYELLGTDSIVAVPCDTENLFASMVAVWKKSNTNRYIQEFLNPDAH